jgi:predicted lipid-binding transport protein (Tim44 family)
MTAEALSFGGAAGPGGSQELGSSQVGPATMPDAQLIEILIAAMVAGVILFRLYTILGRRTGHEPQPQDRLTPVSATARLRPQPAERPSEPQARSLFDIQLADPSFETGHFLKGARAAYEIILKAFAGGDRASLKPLLSDEVYKAFDAEISKRSTAAAQETLAGITDAHIVNAIMEGRTAEITVSFRAQFAHGTPSSGDYVQRDVTDVWTFARQIGAPSPTWTLVATGGALP